MRRPLCVLLLAAVCFAAEKGHRLLPHRLVASGTAGDVNGDGFVGLDDYAGFPSCMLGPGGELGGGDCPVLDLDGDDDVDLVDYSFLTNAFAPPPAAADDCSNAPLIVGEGQFPINNIFATRDGPAHASCARDGQDQIENDVWFCWQSPCTELIVAETCDSDFDTKIAIYGGCVCPATDGRLRACSDDNCGVVQSRATFDAQSGQQVLIRVGNFPLNEPGTGTLNLTCGFDSCGVLSSGDCGAANGSPGCSDRSCCNDVCAVDPYCCEAEWDEFCVAEADGICGGGFDNCGSGISGSCTSTHATSGCDDAACCNAICSIDPACCIDSPLGWDEICVDLEAVTCFTSCQNSSDNCFSDHGTPGCQDVSCCEQVCPRSPYCCQVAWDVECAGLAKQFCD